MHCKGGGSIIKDEEPDIGWQSHHFVRRKCAEKDVVSTDLGEPRRNGRRRDFCREMQVMQRAVRMLKRYVRQRGTWELNT